MIRSTIILVVIMIGAIGGCQRAKQAAVGPQVEIDGKSYQVEVASTAQWRYNGLSNRPAPPEEAKGMLFVYPRAQVLDFCMRDCSFPLDIVFVGPDYKVVRTYTMMPEADRAGRKAYSSVAPAQFALEVREGEVAAHHIKPGDQVKFLDVGDPAKAEDSD
jgi:uncharacterized membrane protein (UPF0127 family)